VPVVKEPVTVTRQVDQVRVGFARGCPIRC
jgi:hypothetical protein